MREWTPGRIAVGAPGGHPLNGWFSEDGRAWEVVMTAPAGRSKRMERQIQQTLRHATYNGETVEMFERDGVCIWVSHRDGIQRRWDGLEVGEWVDSSCCDSPAQHSCPTRWTRPDGAVENITLYLRWRWSDPWTGFVFRYDSGQDPFGFLLCEASPNLLPEAPPEPREERYAGLTIHLTSEERGYAKDRESDAKSALVSKADAWLRNCTW